MSKDLNQCNFIGRIGQTVEVKFLSNGNAVANLSIACGDDYTKDGEKVEQTNWVNVTAYGKLAEIIGKYCEKGKQVFISGKLTNSNWEDAEGNKRYKTEIIANEMQLLGGKND